MFDENNCGGGCEDCTADCGYNGSATVTLNLDDGTVQECAVLTIYPAGNRQYIALLPLDENGENSDGEVYIYRFTEASGEPQLENIEDDAEYEKVEAEFTKIMDEEEA